MAPPPRVLAAGDCALVVEYGTAIDAAVNARVRRLDAALGSASHPGILETVPTYRSLTVHYDPLQVSFADLESAVLAADAGLADGSGSDPRTIDIPVAYGGQFGPDLADVAAHSGLTEDEVVAIHAAGDYLVFMMGFMPGFPYLGGLSPRIATPRLATPRTRVPAGSVGIAGAQTGIYPTDSPGGWRVIGRTPVRLFDAGRTPPVPFEAGDCVRFIPVTGSAFAEIARDVAAGSLTPVVQDGPPRAAAWIDVLDGGMLTTVQDVGRVGAQRYGVPPAGAMDGWALRAANRLVGNPDTAACLEMTLVGPELRFGSQAVIALTGADLGARLDGRAVPRWQAAAVAPGAVLSCTGCHDGVRAYLAVAGGIDVRPVLGSRSTFTRSALGGLDGRSLRADDRVPVGHAQAPPSARARRVPRRAVPIYGHVHLLRVVMGPQDDAFTDDGIRTFLTATYTLTAQSDRIGCRFAGPRIAHRAGADIVSDGTAFGSVQVTGEGVPIVLMADRGTTGGYTKIATVTSADLSRLAQASPGDRVRFVRIGLDEAYGLCREAHARLDEIDRPGDHAEAPGAAYEEDSGAPLAADSYLPLADALRSRPVVGAARRDSIRAGMPGLVVSVDVTPGDLAAAGQTLLVVEAMKMQNPVRAPRAGRIGRVLVAPGAQVDRGAVLVEFDDDQARGDAPHGN